MTFFAILLLLLLFFVIAVDFATDCRCAGPEVLPEEVCGLADEAARSGLEDGDSAGIDLGPDVKSGRFNVSALLYLNLVLNVGSIPLALPYDHLNEDIILHACCGGLNGFDFFTLSLIDV